MTNPNRHFDRDAFINDGFRRRVDESRLEDIHIIHNFLSEDQLERGNRLLDKKTISPWIGNPMVHVVSKFSKENMEYLSEIQEQTVNRIYRVFDETEQMYPTDVQLGQWEIGGTASAHTDTNYSEYCIYSSIAYLSGDFEGGTLWFPDIDFEYKPQRGDLILFPSGFIHQVDPVTAGVRRTIIDFYTFDKQYADEYIMKEWDAKANGR